MNAASAREPWEGRVVEGKYPLLELVGSSWQGSVFRTRIATGNGDQAAAIKLIPVDSTEVDTRLSRLWAAMALSHPNLIRILEVGRCQIQRAPAIYVVMEYAEENLAQVIPTRPLTPREAEDTIRPLVNVLAFIHGKGFVHGHINPSNIMAAGNELKLSSDSIHKVDDPAAKIVPSGAYDAPEVAIGAVTPAADVWSLGATLVAALTQQTPGGKLDEKVEAIVSASIPEPFRRIALGCLQSSPSERCTLEQIRQWLDAKTPGPSLVTPAVPRPVTRNRFKTIGIALAALAAFFVVAWISRGGHAKPAQPAETADHTLTTPRPESPPGVQRGNVPGAVVERFLPTAPQSARNTIHGKIRVGVRVNVNSSGEVSEAKLSSPGPSKYFANLALQASRRWKFKPPEVDGQPITSNWSLQFQFARTGTEVVPARTQ